MSTSQALALPAPVPAVNQGRVYQAAAALGATLLVGMIPASASIGLFVIMGAVSFYLLRRAFPAMWLHGVWLAAVYALSFLGATLFALTAAVRSPLAGPVPL